MPYYPVGEQETYCDLNTRFTIGLIGRQWGKSYIAMYRGIVSSIKEKGNYYWIEPTIPQSKVHMKRMTTLFKDFIKSINLTDRIITLINGSTWSFKGADDPENLEGDTLDGGVMDEAAKMTPEVWFSTVRPMLAVKGGWMDFIGKPRGNNWYKQLWIQAQDNPEWSTFHAVSNTSPFFSDKEMEEARRTTPERMFRQEYLAEFIDDEGEVFRGIRECISGRLSDPTYESRYVMGVDLAKTVDWTVLTVMDIESRHVVAWQRFNQIDWSFQESRIVALANKYKAQVRIDATGVGDPIYESLRKKGLHITPVRFTNVIKNHMITNLSMMIEKREITFPELPELINELSLFASEQTKSGNIRYNAPDGYHDDCVISLALACDGLSRRELAAVPM